MDAKPIKIDVSPRIARLPPYLFGRINKMKYEKRVAGVDIIDLGMGNPTDPTPECVIQKLSEAAVDPRNHRCLALLTQLGFKETGRAERTFCIGGEWSDSVYLVLEKEDAR